VGYGICERLLEQLCYASPPDLELQLGGVLNPSSIQEMAEVPPTECLTLVLACRSMSSADAARKSLLRNLDSQLVGRRKTCGYDEHAQRFRENLRIDLQYIDMAVMSSVLKTAAELRQRRVFSSSPSSGFNVSIAPPGTPISPTSFATRAS
jgi:3-keto steroid reductase